MWAVLAFFLLFAVLIGLAVYVAEVADRAVNLKFKCPVCGDDKVITKPELVRLFPSGEIYHCPFNCKACGAVMRAHIMSLPWVKEMVAKTEQNKRANELYDEFLKQLGTLSA